jgi:hypothetical protein
MHYLRNEAFLPGLLACCGWILTGKGCLEIDILGGQHSRQYKLHLAPLLVIGLRISHGDGSGYRQVVEMVLAEQTYRTSQRIVRSHRHQLGRHNIAYNHSLPPVCSK